MVTVVDDDIDPTDSSAVEYAMATRFQADKDLVIIKNVRGSSLDPSSDQKKLRTSKMGIDATTKTVEDGRLREWPPDVIMSSEIKKLVSQRWEEYGL